MVSSRNWQKNNQAAFDEESKVDFKGMKFEYEYQLAMTMRAFINSSIFGLDYLDSSMSVMEGKLVDSYKDDQYKKAVKDANDKLLRISKICNTKDGFDTDRYNAAVHENIMSRWKAINELLFRKNMAPQLAEFGVLD